MKRYYSREQKEEGKTIEFLSYSSVFYNVDMITVKSNVGTLISGYNIDRNTDNPRYCSCIAEDLFKFFSQLERQHAVDVNYIRKQSPVFTESKRAALVSQMVIGV